MKKPFSTRELATFAAVTWCLAVPICYYVYNFAYYREKLMVFGSYIIGLMR